MSFKFGTYIKQVPLLIVDYKTPGTCPLIHPNYFSVYLGLGLRLGLELGLGLGLGLALGLG